MHEFEIFGVPVVEMPPVITRPLREFVRQGYPGWQPIGLMMSEIPGPVSVTIVRRGDTLVIRAGIVFVASNFRMTGPLTADIDITIAFKEEEATDLSRGPAI